MTASFETNPLQRVYCIHYLVQFQRDQPGEVRALIYSSSKVNTMTPIFRAKLSLSIRHTSIGSQKIDGSALKTYRMTIAGFLIQDGLSKIRFFEKTFLLAETSMDLVLGMPFLSLSNADIQFNMGNLTWRTYSIAKALPITKRVELIDKYKFARAVLDENSETFLYILQP